MSENNFEILVLRKKNIKDFARERNRLLAKSKKEWVLFLDTDEKLSRRLEREIRKVTKSGKFNAYKIERKNIFLGKPAGTDTIVRLAKKNAGTWKRSVHEYWEVEGPVGHLNGEIIHNTGDSFTEMFNKVNFYSSLHARENKKEGKTSNFLKIFFYPPLKFVESLILGRGIAMSVVQYLHSLFSWIKLWELQKV